jgi:hypothetical protein
MIKFINKKINLKKLNNNFKLFKNNIIELKYHTIKIINFKKISIKPSIKKLIKLNQPMKKDLVSVSPISPIRKTTLKLSNHQESDACDISLFFEICDYYYSHLLSYIIILNYFSLYSKTKLYIF